MGCKSSKPDPEDVQDNSRTPHSISHASPSSRRTTPPILNTTPHFAPVLNTNLPSNTHKNNQSIPKASTNVPTYDMKNIQEIITSMNLTISSGEVMEVNCDSHGYKAYWVKVKVGTDYYHTHIWKLDKWISTKTIQVEKDSSLPL